jgi:hypothetical protein
MFNWVCPQCGKDVPPSKTECPFCAERAKEAALAGQAPPQQREQPQEPAWYQQQPPPQGWQPPQQHPPGWQPAPQPPSPPPGWQPQQQQPPQPYQQTPYESPAPRQTPPQHRAAPQPQPGGPQQQPGHPPQWAGHQPPNYAPPPPPATHWGPPQERRGPPTWLMGAAFTLAFLGILAALYFFFQRSGRTNAVEKAGLENPRNASEQKVTNPLQKYVEVVGIRMTTDNRKPVAKFVVVNHSGADIADLAANVTLWASTSRSEEDSVGSFSFKVNGLGPNSSKEMSEPLKTKLKPYELPDWQNTTAEIQITSPRP